MKHMYLSKQTMCVRWKSIWDFVSLWELSFFIKEYFLQLSSFKVEMADVCSKYDYWAELKKYMYLSKENYLCCQHHILGMVSLWELCYFWKEYFLIIIVSNVDISSFCSK
jgi:hypothetical protein